MITQAAIVFSDEYYFQCSLIIKRNGHFSFIFNKEMNYLTKLTSFDTCHHHICSQKIIQFKNSLFCPSNVLQNQKVYIVAGFRFTNEVSSFFAKSPEFDLSISSASI